MAYISFLVLVSVYQIVVSGFYQNTYVLEHSHIAVDQRNDDYFSAFKVYNVKFNRTTRTFGVDFTLAVPITDNVNLKIEAYVFLSNEYKKFPAFQLNSLFCKDLNDNLFGIRDSLKYSNVTFVCPLKQGSYYARNILIDESKLTPAVPYGKYRMTFTLTKGKDRCVSISWYGAILPKNKLQG